MNIGDECCFCEVICNLDMFVVNVINKRCKEIFVVYDVGREFVSCMFIGDYVGLFVERYIWFM